MQLTDPLVSAGRALLLGAAISLAGAALAQGYEGSPCAVDEEGAQALNPKALAHKASALRVVLDADYPGLYTYNATSFLAAGPFKVAPPPAPEDPSMADPELLWEWEAARDAHSCRYGPGQASDADPKTAWCEGVEGHGVGESLVVGAWSALKPGTQVEIFAGFGKSPKLHKANARPKEVVLRLFRVKEVGAAQVVMWGEGLTLLGEATHTLRDHFGPQRLPLPAQAPSCEGEEESCALVLSVTIKSVYPGRRYKDTCISELGFFDPPEAAEKKKGAGTEGAKK